MLIILSLVFNKDKELNCTYDIYNMTKAQVRKMPTCGHIMTYNRPLNRRQRAKYRATLVSVNTNA